MKGTPLTNETVDYMTELFPVDDDILEHLKSEAAATDIPDIQISSEQGAFMQVFLKAMGARRVLEIGTLAGYSAILMARALPEGGKVISLERDPMHAEFAKSQVERAGLSEKIEIRIGSALDLLDDESFAGEGPFDFVFIDADKPSYSQYLELVYPLVRKGGVVAGDNALAWGQITDRSTDDPDIRGMQEFNRAMAEHPGLQCCIVPVGDGMCIGVVV
jgi:predicted O-methyltransferase YrrM